MNIVFKGLMGLVLWLVVGFGLTEVTVLAMSAWLTHESQQHRTSVASQEASP
jgi:hypothetical protein